MSHLCRTFWGGSTSLPAPTALRRCGFEQLEPRQLRAADLHLGAVYFEEASGDDSAGDRIEITFAGGQPGTQLNSLTINGDKLLDGSVTIGDIFFDTVAGGPGSFKSGALSIVSHNGFTITNVVVQDGSPLITFQFAGFDAGEKLVFEIDVDEQGSFSSTSVAEGGEFEGARLTGTFTNPHFEDSTLTPLFYDAYDDEFAQAAARAGTRLDLPPDSYTPPHTVDREDRTAGAVTTHKEVAKPITISGRVFHDPNLSNSQDADEPGLAGVSLGLLRWNGTTYHASGKTATTNTVGDYTFDAILPGTYRIVEAQPSGYRSVGSRPGTINGTTVGVSASPDVISEITLLGGQDSVRNDFAEVLPGSISGRVYADPEGDCVFGPHDTALAGVEVHLLDANGAVLQTTFTNGSGQYAFDALLPGTYGVREVQPAGYYQGGQKIGSSGGVIPDVDVTSQIVLTAATGAVDYDFCELFPAQLSGRVFADPEGDGQLGAKDLRLRDIVIELLDSQGAIVHTTQTNAQGEYRFTNLAPGVYTVRETQPAGYYQGGQRAGSHGGNDAVTNVIGQITLGSSADAIRYDFWELLPGSISGRVHADPEGDCVFGPHDIPLAGVVVQLLDAGGNVLQTTLTNNEGDYRFEDLAPGTYAVRQFQPEGYYQGDQHAGSAGGVIVGDDHIAQIIIRSATDAVRYDFCELLPASVRGRVHADPEGDCIFGPHGIPLAGVKIELLDEHDSVVATSFTDAEGNYHFTNLAPGEYTLRETQPAGYYQGGTLVGDAGGVVKAPDVIGAIVLTSARNANNYDFCEAIPGSISGRVFADPDEDCLFGPRDIPLAGVQVDLLDANGQQVATTLTDAQGKYSFNNLAPGTYAVREHQPGGYFQGGVVVGSAGGVATGDVISQIVLTSATDAVNYNFCETPGGDISGYVFQDGATIVSPPGQPIDPTTVRNGVRDADDLPIAGVTLFLGDFSGEPILDALGRPRTALTDADGFYQFTDLPPGIYTVRQIQPVDYIDFIDTPGTTGGIAINRNDEISPQILETLTVAHNFDSIIRIPLPAGATSIENNFSEIQTAETSLPPPPLPPPPTPRSSPLPVFFAEPINPQAPPIYSPGGVPQPLITRFISEPIAVFIPPLLLSGNSGGTSTWHLSVVNGGTPRGARSGETLVEAPSSVFNVSTWTGTNLDEAQWMLVGDSDEPAKTVLFGAVDAIPVAGDFNGDGRSEIGAFIDGDWFIDINGNGHWDEDDLWAKLGAEGDLPVVGDWDGDGKDDIGVFGRAWSGDPRAIAREPGLPHSLNKPKAVAKNLPPSKEDAPLRRRMIKVSVEGVLRADLIDHVFNFGVTGDHPVAGDWAGNGVDCIGVFRNGAWHLDVDGDGLFNGMDRRADFGRYGDVPVVGDWNGDGIDELGVYREGEWILDTNRNYRIDAEDLRVQMGQNGDQPTVGDWNADGRDQIGLMREGRIEHEARR